MPVYLRTFNIRRLQKVFDKQKKEHETQMRQAKSKSKGRSRPPKIGRR
jgi:hypothetical protein